MSEVFLSPLAVHISKYIPQVLMQMRQQMSQKFHPDQPVGQNLIQTRSKSLSQIQLLSIQLMILMTSLQLLSLGAVEKCHLSPCLQVQDI